MKDDERKKIIESWIKTLLDNNKKEKYLEQLKEKSLMELKKERDSHIWYDVCFGNILDDIFIKYNKVMISKINKIIKEKSK